MDPLISSDKMATSAARLMIHADADPGAANRQSMFRLERLRLPQAVRPRPGPRAPLQLHVDDLRGLRVLVIEDAGTLTALDLPAGTYKVTANRCQVTRGYTMTLQQGDSLDLYLRLPPSLAR